MATLQRTGLGNLKGKHIATSDKLHFAREKNSEEAHGEETRPLVDDPPCCNLC